ncbi:M28 family peptidase [candidate division KSB1 bacterium]
MRRLLIFALIISLFTFFNFQVQTEKAKFDEAYYAWDAGDYIKALKGFKEILNSSAYSTYLERIALVTGELYHVEELSIDGRALAFSPDGKYAKYEMSSGSSSKSYIVDILSGNSKIAEITGRNLVFSPNSPNIAFLSVKETNDLKEAREALAASGRRSSPDVTWLEAVNTELALYDLNTKKQRTIDTGDLIIVDLAFGADGSAVYFTAGEKGNTANCDIYKVSVSGGDPEKVTDSSGFVSGPVCISGGRYLTFSKQTRNPIPQPPAEEAVQPAGRGGRAGGRGSGGRAPGEFIIKDLSSGAETSITGGSVSVSSSGNGLVFTTSNQGENIIHFSTMMGVSKELFKTTDRIGAPGISPDGSSVVFEMMTKDDYELYVVKTDGSDEVKRISKEIQHDRKPFFLTNDLVISAKGEGRHQRAYIYDLNTGRNFKLFHNNTVRTISPEYEWAANLAGDKLLIVAERDGDTITPERGVYILDFNRKVTRDELLVRMDNNLKTETDLRERGEKMFKPIYDEVKEVTEQISVSRLFEYEFDLYQFGSKNVSQPGNEMAREYLFNKLKDFGYQPENQWFEARGGIRTANVLATLRGTVNPELIYVISSHFDSNARNSGADDNTSASVALLEAARVMKDYPMPATIVFALFTGEESGLLGSREYVRQAVESNMKLVGALNNDMVGWAENHRLDNTIRYSNAGIRDVQHASSFLFSKLITYDAHYYKSTDAAAYYDAYGDIVGGIGSYPVLGSPFYHQVTDRLETINHQLIAEVSKSTTATLMLLASSPSRINGLKIDSTDKNSANISWTPSPENGITHYLVAFGNNEDPLRTITKVKEPKAVLFQVNTGDIISVKAVNSNGLEGWDWAKIKVEK